MKTQTKNKAKKKRTSSKSESENTVKVLLKNQDFKNLLQETIKEVFSSQTVSPERKEKVQDKLTKADDKLRIALEKKAEEAKEAEESEEIGDLDDLDSADLERIERLEKKGVKVILPNLKYRKPKYNNVGEMMKYVESDAGTGEGVKLVIMNFND